MDALVNQCSSFYFNLTFTTCIYMIVVIKGSQAMQGSIKEAVTRRRINALSFG